MVVRVNIYPPESFLNPWPSAHSLNAACPWSTIDLTLAAWGLIREIPFMTAWDSGPQVSVSNCGNGPHRECILLEPEVARTWNPNKFPEVLWFLHTKSMVTILQNDGGHIHILTTDPALFSLCWLPLSWRSFAWSGTIRTSGFQHQLVETLPPCFQFSNQ